MSNSAELYFDPNRLDRPVRIFIDSPENCGNPPHSILLQNKPVVDYGFEVLGVNLIGSGQSLLFGAAEVYVVGDGDKETSEDPPPIRLENNNTNISPLGIYAPSSEVSVQNRARLEGGIIASELVMGNNTALIPLTGGVLGFTSAITPIYERTLYRECAAAPPPADQAPDTGC